MSKCRATSIYFTHCLVQIVICHAKFEEKCMLAIAYEQCMLRSKLVFRFACLSLLIYATQQTARGKPTCSTVIHIIF